MFFQQLVNGLTLGSTYALVAIGYTMIFGILELINFSHGSVYMAGAYITLVLTFVFKGNFILAFAFSLILTGILGALVDRLALRRLRIKKSTKIITLISTIGIQTFIDNCILVFFGSETKVFPNFLEGTFKIGTTIISYIQVMIFVVTLILMILLSLLVYKTKIGKAMRATAQNMDAATLMGINVNLVITGTFFIGSVLAAVAGTMIGMYYQSIDGSMGFVIGLKTFASAVLGGVGILPGAMVGGMLLGVIETIGASYVSSGYRDAIAFAILIIFLIFKPTGLLGKKEINKV